MFIGYLENMFILYTPFIHFLVCVEMSAVQEFNCSSQMFWMNSSGETHQLSEIFPDPKQQQHFL